ncbi:MAG: response regulator transcription factor [Pirellulales bacterium]
MLAGLKATLLKSGYDNLVHAESIANGIRMAKVQEPELFVFHSLDTNEDSWNAIEEIRLEMPKVLMIVVSHYPNRHYANKLLERGIQGCLCLRATEEDLLAAVKSVTNGEHFLSVAFENTLSEFTTFGEVGKDLSERELQVLSLIGDGKPTKAIANQLGLALSSVETYRERIKTKLRLMNTQELTRFAILWKHEHPEGK